MGHHKRRPLEMDGEMIARNRRLSHGESTRQAVSDVRRGHSFCSTSILGRRRRDYALGAHARGYGLQVSLVLTSIGSTDCSFQISIFDSGPKLMALGTASSNAHKTFDIRVSPDTESIDFADVRETT